MSSWRISDLFANFTSGVLERVTGGVKQIATDHAMIHAGRGYRLYVRMGEVVGVTLLLTTGDKYLHFKNVKLHAKGGGLMFQVKRATIANPMNVTADGSAFTLGFGPTNLNDKMGNGTGVAITQFPTYTGGEPWLQMDLFAKRSEDTTDRLIQSDYEEIVMKPNTKYILYFEQVGTTAPNPVCADIFWYEEDDG